VRVIIAGSEYYLDGREFDDYFFVSKTITKSPFRPYIKEIIVGGAKGVDSLGERYAREHSFKLRIIAADWNKYGNSAGMIRNREMAENADALIAIKLPDSKEIVNMIKVAVDHNLHILSITYRLEK